MAPLKSSDIIPEARRLDFVEQVFWNIPDIIAVNTRLRDAFNKRQKSYAVVESISDIFLDAVPHFGPFVSYGAHQLYGKYEFEKEKSSNVAFSQFVEVRAPMVVWGNSGELTEDSVCVLIRDFTDDRTRSGVRSRASSS